MGTMNNVLLQVDLLLQQTPDENDYLSCTSEDMGGLVRPPTHSEINRKSSLFSQVDSHAAHRHFLKWLFGVNPSTDEDAAEQMTHYIACTFNEFSNYVSITIIPIQTKDSIQKGIFYGSKHSVLILCIYIDFSVPRVK